MTKDELQAIGLTPEDVLNRLTEKLCDRFVDDETGYANDFQKRLEQAVKQRVDEVLKMAMEDHVYPKVAAMIEGICLEETNRWGEKKGSKLTFTEYLVNRMDEYIREDVNYEGKSKAEKGDYSWSKSSTRLTHLIHEHLQYSIQNSVRDMLQLANDSVRKSLQESVKTAIDSIKVTVNTKVEKI